jgi:membrane protein YqaA with SNARE-associated domain
MQASSASQSATAASRRDSSTLGAGIAGFVWGMAEASFFFIVPDVLISAVALRSGRAAFAAVAGSLVGACIAGAAMFHWSRIDPASAHAAVDAVPFIPARLFELAQSLSAEHGGLAILFGSFIGVPYKVFAIQAPESLTIAAFLGWTLPGRAARFVLSAIVASWLARKLRSRWPMRAIVAGWALIWIAIYAGYWTEMAR